VTGDLAEAQVYVERARALADGIAAAKAAELQARILLHSGDYAEALHWLEEARALASRAGDQSIAAQTLYDTGISYYYQDRFEEALQYFRQAQPLYQKIGDRRGEINTLLMFGTVYSRQGEHEAALERLNEALSDCHAIGWRHGETYVLGNLANSYFDLGDYETTRELHTHALALAREIGDREGEAASLSTLALVAHRLGNPAAAMDLYRQASAIQSALGYLLGEGYTLTGMGHALADLGDLDAAEHAFRDAAKSAAAGSRDASGSGRSRRAALVALRRRGPGRCACTRSRDLDGSARRRRHRVPHPGLADLLPRLCGDGEPGAQICVASRSGTGERSRPATSAGCRDQGRATASLRMCHSTESSRVAKALRSMMPLSALRVLRRMAACAIDCYPSDRRPHYHANRKVISDSGVAHRRLTHLGRRDLDRVRRRWPSVIVISPHEESPIPRHRPSSAGTKPHQ
jgi:tetratricopeptide (TPR) repeat protein